MAWTEKLAVLPAAGYLLDDGEPQAWMTDDPVLSGFAAEDPASLPASLESSQGFFTRLRLRIAWAWYWLLALAFCASPSARAETPEETIAFMKDVKKPWIAYKILGAGAIHPREGFQYAFQNGADFACVGMFDFQVAEDVAIGREVLAAAKKRPRPWCA